jgi:hypothetical protein
MSIELKRAVEGYYSDPTVIGWQDDTLWLIIGNKIAGVDTLSGKLSFIWQ